MEGCSVLAAAQLFELWGNTAVADFPASWRRVDWEERTQRDQGHLLFREEDLSLSLDSSLSLSLDSFSLSFSGFVHRKSPS